MNVHSFELWAMAMAKNTEDFLLIHEKVPVSAISPPDVYFASLTCLWFSCARPL
jgi:hypothetical protein